MKNLLILILLLTFSIISTKINAQMGYDYGVGDAYEIGIASPDDSNVNLDTISKNDTIYHTFNIKNIGTGDLRFTKVKCSYGCDIVEYTQDSISQGDTGIVKAAVYYFDRLKKQRRIIDFHCDGKFKYQQLFLEVYIKE